VLEVKYILSARSFVIPDGTKTCATTVARDEGGQKIVDGVTEPA
jgi:hypothetical protein